MQNSTFSSGLLGGSYSINKDGTGILSLNLTRGSIKLAIALSSSSSLYLIEFDSFANGAGTALQQTTSAFSTPSGTFVFHLNSSQANNPVLGSVSSAGSMTVKDGVTIGQEDVVRAGVTSSSIFTGSMTAPDANGRGTETLTDNAGNTSNYVYYVIDAGTLKFMETDSGQLGSGQADAQVGAPFSNASLSNGFAFTYAGDTLANGSRANIAGAFTTDGKGNIVSGTYDFVQGSNPISNAPLTGTYQVAPNGRATITLNPVGSSPIPLIAWIASSAKTFILVNSPEVVESGRLEQQQDGPFSTASLSGTFAFYESGYDSQRLQSIVRVGLIQFDGSTSLSFTDYFVNRNGSTAQNGPVSGNYTASPDGRILAFSVGPTNSQVIYLMSNSSGDLVLGANGSNLAGSILQQAPPP